MDTLKLSRALAFCLTASLLCTEAILSVSRISAQQLPASISQDVSRSLAAPQTPSLQQLPHPGTGTNPNAELVASGMTVAPDQPVTNPEGSYAPPAPQVAVGEVPQEKNASDHASGDSNAQGDNTQGNNTQTDNPQASDTQVSGTQGDNTKADNTQGDSTTPTNESTGNLSRELTREEIRQLEGEEEHAPQFPEGFGTSPGAPLPEGAPAGRPDSKPDSHDHHGGRLPPPVQVVVVPDAKNPENTQDDEPTEAETEKAVFVSQTHTPRMALAYFLKAADSQNYAKAAKLLDFSKRPGISDIEKQEAAFQLYEVLHRLSEPNPDLLPDDKKIDGYRYQPNSQYAPLFLVKQDGSFVFSAESVTKISDMLEVVKDMRPAICYRLPFFRSISDWWFRSSFGLRHIQWMALFLILLIGYVIGLLCSTIIYYVVNASFHLMSKDLSEYKISKKTWRPIGWFVMYVIWYVGLLISLVPPKIVHIMGSPLKILAILMFVVTGLRFINVLALWTRRHLINTKSRLDEILVPLVSRALKIILVIIGTITIFQTFGFSAVGIISGMGIGGIAIALAAQNTIANLFGSITVLMDRPFVIGDWIVTNSIEGEVEVVGLRSTRIRTFYNSLVTVPNNVLTTAIIDNMGRRHFRRYKTMLGVQYDTPPERIEAFCEGIRELILSYNFTRKDKFFVYPYEFSASSIDILLNCFFLVPDSGAEYKARSTLILDILRLAEKMDVRFAFPTQTIYNVSTQDQAYSDPHMSPDEFGRRSAAGIVERREAIEKARRRASAIQSHSDEEENIISMSDSISDSMTGGSVIEPLSRKTEEVLKKRNFFRRAG